MSIGKKVLQEDYECNSIKHRKAPSVVILTCAYLHKTLSY